MPITTGISDGSVKTPTGKEVVQFWKKSEKFLDYFWRIWSKQYLTELRNKTSAEEQKRKPMVGDVVLMIDPSQRRGYWRAAVIEKLIPSQSDKRCRAAQVRVSAKSRFIRPIVKLAPLELLNELRTSSGPKRKAVRFAKSVQPEGAEEDLADFPQNELRKYDDEVPSIELQLRNVPES